jgi:hypothetical protein
MKKIQPRRRQLTRRERIQELRCLMRVCFELINEPDIKEAANRTRLSVTTLRRIGGDDPSLKMQHNTIKAMVEAAQLTVTMEDGRYLLSVKDTAKRGAKNCRSS